MGKKLGIGCLGIIAVFFVLGVIGAMFGGGSGSHKDSSSNSNNTKQEVQAEPEYTCDVEGVGKVIGKVSSNVGIAIYKVEERDVLGDNPYMQKKPQGKFVVVSVVVSNEQKDAVTVDASSFKLVDKDGREYSYSTEGQMAIQVGNGDAKGFLTQLNPGITTNFEIPYDVPKKLELSNITLKARGGMTGKEITLPLVVQKK